MEPSHPLSLYIRACGSLLGLRKEVPFKNTVVMDTMVLWYRTAQSHKRKIKTSHFNVILENFGCVMQTTEAKFHYSII